MPARKKRSKAAMQRKDTKKNVGMNHIVEEKPQTFQHIPLQSMEKTVSRCVISGSLHQGDVRFLYPGVQCTFISLWALVLMESKPPLLWKTADINGCVIDGNDRFLEHCFSIQIQPRQLLVKELPQSINAGKSYIKLDQLDSNIKVGTLDKQSLKNTTVDIFTIDEAILRSFDQFTSCFLVCGGQTIALAKRQNRFFVFDSHSRGKDGLLHHVGSAVLVSFIDVQGLIAFIKQLFLESLRLKSNEQFELVPVTISKQSLFEEKTKEAAISIASTCLKSTLETASGASKKTNPNDQVAPITSATNSFGKENLSVVALHERDMQSYFDDQEKRDTKYRKTVYENKYFDKPKHDRKEYMKGYMQKRRIDDSFRKKSNELSQRSKIKLQSTKDGRQRYNEQAKKLRRNMVSDEKKQKLKKQSADRKQKVLSTEEGRQKHNKQSAEGMTKILGTKKGKENITNDLQKE